MLFEDPFWLYVLFAMVEAVLLVFWWKDRTRKRAIRLAYPVVAGIVIFALAAWVVTDREKIIAAIHEIGREAESGRIHALEKRLDAGFTGNFEGEKMDRDRVLETARNRIRAHRVTKVTFKKIVVEVKDKKATVRMLTLVRLEMFRRQDRLPLVWEMEWVKRGNRWTILHCDRPRVALRW